MRERCDVVAKLAATVMWQSGVPAGVVVCGSSSRAAHEVQVMGENVEILEIQAAWWTTTDDIQQAKLVEGAESPE